MSYFELYNKMRVAARNFRPSGGSRPTRFQRYTAAEAAALTHRCPRCREPLLAGARCEVCAVAAVDALAARVGAFDAWPVFLRRAHRWGHGARRVRRHDAQLTAKLERATRRADARDRSVHLRGRLSVISPVQEPTSGELVGAYVSRWEESDPCLCRPRCSAETRWSQTEVNAGLLVVEGDDLVVCVGFAGEPLRVWHRAGDLDAPVVARTGDEVEVLGVLRERPDIHADLGRADYRSQGATRESLEGPGWLVI